jgi:hypothetical protein
MPGWVLSAKRERPLSADFCPPRLRFQRLLWREQTLRLHNPESLMCPSETLVNATLSSEPHGGKTSTHSLFGIWAPSYLIEHFIKLLDFR